MEKKHPYHFHNQRSTKKLKREEEFHKKEPEDVDYHNHIEEQMLAIQEENDAEKIRGESRKRRQAILEKYKHKHQKIEEEVDKAQNGVDNNSTLVVTVKIEKILNENSTKESASSTNLLGEKSQHPNHKHSSDMFGNDMFTKSPLGNWKGQKGKELAINSSSTLHDNWDDGEGRYRFHLREILDGRYCILKSLGSGVFSTVVEAHDLKASENDPKEVAIKIIHNNHTMHKSGLDEVNVLKNLAKQDAENRKHCVRLLSSFEYRNHLCLVFEYSHMNLRQVLNKYGRNIGINLDGVQACARQIFIALQHLQDCGVLHCDIKLDNILANESMDVRKLKLKLGDFGSSMFVGKNEIAPYLVSRYYRAPEIILGLPYNHALDMWSTACCLCEIYIGEVLFPGHTNNEMLQLHMKLMGTFPKKMLKRALFQKSHFDRDLNFYTMEEDLVTKKMVPRIIRNDFFAKFSGIRPLIMDSKKGSENTKLVAQFIDLLTKMLTLDPSKRMTVVEALNHPFILK